MRIEIVGIGSELLKGLIVNSNAAEISKALLNSGYQTDFHLVLPDDPVILKLGLKASLERSDIVITTGGLGPTCDDITRQIAAELFDSDFYFNEEIAASLQQRYGDIVISLDNQATVPSKAIILKNEIGTAPGLIFHANAKTLILLPGVPFEMRELLHGQVIPYLRQHFPHSCYERRFLYFFDFSESAIDPCLRELQVECPHIEFGIYPSAGLVTVQMTIEYLDVDKANAELAKASSRLMSQFSAHYLDLKEGKVEKTVHERFIEKKLTLSIAESCTGGAISARLTKIPGVSNYFLGGVVAYSNLLKQHILNVPESLLSTYGAVSQEVVAGMASGVLAITGSDFALAVSGIAGPESDQTQKPVGTVWIAVAKRGDKDPYTLCIQAYGNREMIIERSINSALAYLLRKSI